MERIQVLLVVSAIVIWWSRWLRLLEMSITMELLWWIHLEFTFKMKLVERAKILPKPIHMSKMVRFPHSYWVRGCSFSFLLIFFAHQQSETQHLPPSEFQKNCEFYSDLCLFAVLITHSLKTLFLRVLHRIAIFSALTHTHSFFSLPLSLSLSLSRSPIC